MRISPTRANANGLTIRTDAGLLALTPRTSRMMRVRLTLEDAFSQRPSLAVIPVGAQAPTIPFSVVEGRDGIVISTDAMSIEVAREYGCAHLPDDRWDPADPGAGSWRQDADRPGPGTPVGVRRGHPA